MMHGQKNIKLSMSGVFEGVWTVRSGVLLLGAEGGVRCMEDGSCCMKWVSWNWNKVDCRVASATSQTVCVIRLIHRRNCLTTKMALLVLHRTIRRPKTRICHGVWALILWIAIETTSVIPGLDNQNIGKLFAFAERTQKLWQTYALNESRFCDPRIRIFEDSIHFDRVTTGGRWNCSEWGSHIIYEEGHEFDTVPSFRNCFYFKPSKPSTGVAQWLRRCATSRTVLGSIPGVITGFFSDIFLPTVPWPWGRLSP
jgi:hypothetical protein